MRNVIIVEETFHSKWLETEGTVKIEARRICPKGIGIYVDIDSKHYEEIIENLSWNLCKMLVRNPSKTADIIVFKECCIVADGEIWTMKEKVERVISVSCKTAQHFCEGLRLIADTGKEDIRESVISAIENESPF